MLVLRRTPVFQAWIDASRDRRAATRILARIARLGLGNPGDVRPVGAGLSEMRIDHGPGYRVYYVHRGTEIVVLLCGGDKTSQDRDICEAKRLVKDL